MSDSTPIIPTVHLNGTHGPRLLEQYQLAAATLRSALDAMLEACPHGRDYYPQGDDVIQKAIQEHQARMDAVRRVGDEILAIARGVAAQMRGK